MILLLIIFTVCVITAIKKWHEFSNRRIKRQKVAARIKKEQQFRIENFKKLYDQLTSDDQSQKDIDKLDDDELIDALQSGKVSALEVLRYFQRCAYAITKEKNCIIEFLLDAVDFARELDQKYAGKQKPPLFGLPFSVKENMPLSGRPVTRLLGRYLDDVCKDDCSIVQHLRSMGAIPFCRTNLPQTMMAIACSNPIFGRTENPIKNGFTPGGSSGGEACLVRLRGAFFGTGSDLAGSLRIPALCSGVVTMKSSADRITCKGAAGGYPGNYALKTGYGYFTRNTRHLQLLMKVTLTQSYFNMELSAVPMPYKEQIEILPPKLHIGYFIEDGFLDYIPSVTRITKETIAHLKATTPHNYFEFKLPRPCDAACCLYSLTMPDAGTSLLEQIQYEPNDQYLAPMWIGLQVPVMLRRLGAYILANRSKVLSMAMSSGVTSIYELLQRQKQLDEYKLQLMHDWQQAGLDALICPAFPITAPRYEQAPKLFTACFSTGLWNMLDYCAGVVPVGKVTAQDDIELKGITQSSKFSKPLHHLVAQACSDSEGLPVSIQIVTPPYQEELNLALLRMVEESL